MFPPHIPRGQPGFVHETSCPSTSGAETFVLGLRKNPCLLSVLPVMRVPSEQKIILCCSWNVFPVLGHFYPDIECRAIFIFEMSPFFRNSVPYRLLARHSSQFFLLFFSGSNDLLTHQKIEPRAGSVVESVGQDFWYFLFTAALDILAGS
jgi:hypothetical protein